MTTTGTLPIEYALNAPARSPLAMTTERRRSSEISILSPDGRFLAVPGENHTVLVLDATTNEPWVTYYGHQAGVYRRVGGTIKALAWLPGGSSIASGSTDGSIHLWHARSGIHQRTLTQPQEDCAVLALVLSHEGCLTALRGRNVTTWQLN
jgi:WD40 repeat protein